MFGLREFRLRVFCDEFLLRVPEAPARPNSEQDGLARHVLLELRFGLEGYDPEITELTEQLASALPGDGLLHPPARSYHPAYADSLLAQLDTALAMGWLTIERVAEPTFAARRRPPPPEPPPPPRPKKERPETFFEVRFIDEIGEPITGVETELTVSGKSARLTTNGAGVALLEGVLGYSGDARVHDVEGLERVLNPRWDRQRFGKPPKEGNTTKVSFVGEPIGPVPIKAAVPNTVIIQPPRGRLHVQLLDKSGRVKHAGCRYTVRGPETFSGKTDESGVLVHEDVLPGEYTLELEVPVFEGKDQQLDRYQSPLVVLTPASTRPETRMLGAVPFSVLARLHLFFNTNKAFLLPTALPGMRRLRQLCLENDPSQLLIVGHADTAGDAAGNDSLSLERAEATLAFLKDDVDGWLSFYGSSVPSKRRWGAAEDRMMLVALPDFRSKPRGQSAITWFQTTRGLNVTGKADATTRRQLVTEYMALDGETLPELGSSITLTAHGCGEHFPLDDSGEAVDAAPADGRRDPGDRRVELFFFDPEFGIVPPPPGQNSKAGSPEYPAWRKSVSLVHDLTADTLEGPVLTFIELVDAHFRTNSAVILPEGETPTSDPGQLESLTSVGVFATVLRYNDEHPGLKLLVAGHSDSTGDITFNQKLSEERAQVALALLRGNRAEFVRLCQARHDEVDVTQIFHWAAHHYGFSCQPTRLDAPPSDQRYQQFRDSYNAWLEARDPATEPDPRGSAPLARWGRLDPTVWGAIFDLYEHKLREELGEDAAGVAGLRSKLVFVDDARPALGFSEYFPIEELGVDNYKSQANRRVEVLFFEDGEEPDLEHAEADPETAEVYLPGVYRRTPLAPLPSAKPWRAYWERQEEPANMGEVRFMVLDAPGLPSGCPVVMEVTEFIEGADPVSCGSVAGSSSDGTIKLPFDAWYDPERRQRDASQLLKASPNVSFRFSASTEQRIKAAGQALTYSDYLEVQVVHREDETGSAGIDCRVQTPWGIHERTTDEDGVIKVDHLAPGGCRVTVGSAYRGKRGS